ncbi:DNA polymerase IV [Pseudonocardia humida]|uniref:DNA polymerase IV n=1 Tax=Pseudonocardia humida TaxID=2800819 RepID=A0ABT1A6Q2_9PSEU|nr:DNA polymerase IV [Pseudonocardia humida]MCO1658688.1 DNA polymerase IV [Pseudonocardia humida]
MSGPPDADPAWVLHVDLDQFLAAVEVLRHPELAGRPVVVGGRGDPTQRGVVAAASYPAREHGVRAGTPLRTAAKRCPDAVFLPADNPHYEEVSERVMAILRDTPGAVVEVMGWDEAFVGVRTADPEATARAIQAAVLDGTGLHCTVGIGDNLLRAKIATGFGKPAGVHRLTADTWDEVMGDRPTRALWGIGAKTAAALAERGLTTVRELGAADPEALAAELGPMLGPWYVQLGRGIGRREVSATPWVRRSRSRETTFQTDLDDWDRIRTETAALARRVADDITADGRPALRVAVKVRFVPFTTRSRSKTLPTPTTDATAFEAAALEVLDRFRRGRAVRLLGVRAEYEKP